ncbi:MAG: GNAT family N-acetyltransferase [Planctomycetota bacterium]
MKLQAARPEDLPAIRSLVYAIAEEYGFVPEPDGVDADLNGEAYRYFEQDALFEVLVDEDERVQGVLGMLRLDEATWELRKIYVDSAVRGGGHGRRLIERAVTFARESVAERLVLQTNARLKEAAKLYERAGFVSVDIDDPHSATCDRMWVLELREPPG